MYSFLGWTIKPWVCIYECMIFVTLRSEICYVFKRKFKTKQNTNSKIEKRVI